MRHIASDERGQATAEYALVIVAAAAIALALIIWATSTDLLPSFFTTVLNKVTSVAKGAPIG
jgi:Flp pilus assembly pilin Flp